MESSTQLPTTNGRPPFDIENVALYTILNWMRTDASNPVTGKHYTLTEISRIAGASKGWTESVLRDGVAARFNKKGLSYEQAIRKHVLRTHIGKTRHTEEEDMEALGIRRRPRELVEEMKRQSEIEHEPDDALLPRLPRFEKPVTAPLPQPRKATEPIPFGDRVVERQEPLVKSPGDHRNFVEDYEEIKHDLWELSERIDTLVEKAPGIFKVPLGNFRDKLLSFLQDLED